MTQVYEFLYDEKYKKVSFIQVACLKISSSTHSLARWFRNFLLHYKQTAITNKNAVMMVLLEEVGGIENKEKIFSVGFFYVFLAHCDLAYTYMYIYFIYIIFL